MAAPKIFVLGNVNGQLQSAFSKLTTLHSKNNFAFAIVAGNLFAPEDDDAVTDLLAGKITIPVTTYFTVGTHALPQQIVEKIVNEESEICPNLHYLNKRSITKTSEGVRIATLGGILDPEIVAGQSKEQHLPFHTADDAKALRGANSTDILLTTMWPTSIWKASSTAAHFDRASIVTSDAIADLAATLKPRYHFCPSPDAFIYEREPFFHPPKDASSDPEVTRFISLAPFGNAQKAKAMYAFSLTSSPGPLPQGSTVSPFLARNGISKKRPNIEDEGFSRFANGHDDHRSNRRRKGNRGQRLPPPGPDQCFFCLASQNAENHMVCSIGDDTYLATAKGPLTTSTTFSEYGIDCSCHMIIVPQEHVPSISRTASGQETADRTFAEMSRFKEALQAAVSKKSNHKLGSVFWEINRAANIHAHWQFMPVPADLIQKGLVEAAFKVEAENLKLPGLIVKDFGTSEEVPGDYVRIWIWHEEDGEAEGDGGKLVSQCLLMRFDENVRFDLQYPRKVMAKLLGLEKRTIWQECTQTAEEETQDTTKFRELFQEWDFTLIG
ncbi:cwfJ domain-containing protein [Coniella lustricola]|uniref:CwfJ domain-containing protein n=1 Tax=Coniella lustricola TaxID=2025994 RepID=A0A2T3A923_9PEZI|nr:cwfJ domain-containing protein [Coniella lustricola]